MIRIRFAFPLALVLAVGTTLQADQEPTTLPETTQKSESKVAPIRSSAERGRDVLVKADQAMKKVQTVKYTLHVQRIDVSDEAATKMYGPVIVSGWNGRTPEKFLYEVTTKPSGRTDSATIIVGHDGVQFWAKNMRDKKVLAGPELTSIGPYVSIVDLFPILEFVLEEPFADELDAANVDLMGEVDVAGEACFKVHVDFKNPNQKVTWYFSQKDYLPRRVDRNLLDPTGDMTTRRSLISDIVVDPELPEETFSLVIPEDFLKVDKLLP